MINYGRYALGEIAVHVGVDLNNLKTDVCRLMSDVGEIIMEVLYVRERG